ncbi:hypothetical protein [Desulfofustis glycolicus]|uniref:hypothetical protein n=1 Tax=Desulfofustis glycolicus TaxID=51195 RepID=UPI00137AE153|nr:hypothetical protein [Desulfofustis glycolicus]MCB2214759.1 hypothetical protein [Desulfobulbaceae bacterium]
MKGVSSGNDATIIHSLNELNIVSVEKSNFFSFFSGSFLEHISFAGSTFLPTLPVDAIIHCHRTGTNG